jgi:hypothetical protein
MVMQAGDKVDQTPGLGKANNRLVKLEIFPGIPLNVFFTERLLESLDTRL